jgi:hypothetical protein
MSDVFISYTNKDRRRAQMLSAPTIAPRSNRCFVNSRCSCKRLDLFGRELLAVDGTRIKAVNNKDRNFTRNSLETFIKAADERLADFLRRLRATPRKRRRAARG